MTAILLRVVVLRVDADVWCDVCGLACATTIVYVEERGLRAPDRIYTLTYCEECEASSVVD